MSKASIDRTISNLGMTANVGWMCEVLGRVVGSDDVCWLFEVLGRSLAAVKILTHSSQMPNSKLDKLTQRRSRFTVRSQRSTAKLRRFSAYRYQKKRKFVP